MADDSTVKKNGTGFGYYAGIFTTLAVCLSVTHEYAYFSIIGSKFGHMLTTRDYLSIVVEWAPATFIGFIVGIVAAILLRRVERGMTEDELISTAPYPKFTKYFRKSSDWALLAGVPVISVLAVIFGPNDSLASVGLLGVYFWGALCLYLFSHQSTGSTLPIRVKVTLLLGPNFILISYLFGISHAYADLRVNDGRYAVNLHDGRSLHSDKLLRLLDSGVLFRVESQVTFQPWSQISSLSATVEPYERKIRICQYWESDFCTHANKMLIK